MENKIFVTTFNVVRILGKKRRRMIKEEKLSQQRIYVYRDLTKQKKSLIRRKPDKKETRTNTGNSVGKSPGWGGFLGADPTRGIIGTGKHRGIDEKEIRGSFLSRPSIKTKDTRTKISTATTIPRFPFDSWIHA